MYMFGFLDICIFSEKKIQINKEKSQNLKFLIVFVSCPFFVDHV